ncbi:hypothetical protein P152DRAFT_452921 [Eremomyces bilateralis CBS 781.70]|uniref:Uncharacterized protein n=1 Tax=Eremomyces bilateralis CBS 781.70 TaxID=1392243 RepID=A0A6G1FRE1_9PEZI|nr:uncharacterized protein P152DRAFT_452921 [Eremomyces bilateralis CBS 781.70]KAF1808343.1 hypothetical protein P152DRAFT_452921 [Eremomyces bilateralis CBS 781.70]
MSDRPGATANSPPIDIVSPIGPQDHHDFNLRAVASPVSNPPTSPTDNASPTDLPSESDLVPSSISPSHDPRLRRSELEPKYFVAANASDVPRSGSHSPTSETPDTPLSHPQPLSATSEADPRKYIFQDEKTAEDSPKYLVADDTAPEAQQKYIVVGHHKVIGRPPGYLSGAHYAPEHVADDIPAAAGSSAPIAPRSGGNDAENGEGKPKAKRPILGMKRNVFWLVLIVVALVVVGAAIGGGVGGSIAAKSPKPAPSSAAANSTESSSASSSASLSASPSSTSSSSSAAPTLAVQSPQWPAANFSLALYDEANYSGINANVPGAGIFVLPFMGESYIFTPRTSGCCVRFCLNDKDVGWRCQETWKDRASSLIDKVVVGCERDANTGAGVPPPEQACEFNSGKGVSAGMLDFIMGRRVRTIERPVVGLHGEELHLGV